MKLINPCNSGGSSPILAIYTDNTRTIADYAPAAQGVVAMTSDLDIVLTPPTGATKAKLDWIINGEGDSNVGAQGFVVYRDVAGGGYTLLPNSRDGSENYYSVITPNDYDSDETTTPNATPVSIVDDNPTIGSVNTYRIYCAGTHASTAGQFRLNSALGTVGSGVETCLSTCEGVCI